MFVVSRAGSKPIAGHTSKKPNFDDIEYTFAVVAPSFEHTKFFRVFATECVVCSMPAKHNSFQSEKILAWNAFINRDLSCAVPLWSDDCWSELGRSLSVPDTVLSARGLENTLLNRMDEAINLSVGHFMDLSQLCVDLCMTWHNTGSDATVPVTAPANNIFTRATNTAGIEELHTRHGRIFRSALRCSTQHLLPQSSLKYGGWLSLQQPLLSIRKLLRLAEDIVVIISTLLEVAPIALF